MHEAKERLRAKSTSNPQSGCRSMALCRGKQNEGGTKLVFGQVGRGDEGHRKSWISCVACHF